MSVLKLINHSKDIGRVAIIDDIEYRLEALLDLNDMFYFIFSRINQYSIFPKVDYNLRPSTKCGPVIKEDLRIHCSEYDRITWKKPIN